MSMEPKKTVLIVEDEVNIVDIVRFNLQREGYATLEAYDGEAGLALAREKKPDLILLDVMMPKMMGFDVCRALRAEGALDGDDVARVGDDADDMFITLRRRADRAEAAVRQIAADGAERDGALGVDDGIGKGLGLLFGQAQHEKREPLCALAADAGQARELLNELFERRGKVFHGLNLSAL
mgnify:CR=1 FL=1